jgi:RNA polymerase sigma-70 factor (ECF subfamily)
VGTTGHDVPLGVARTSGVDPVEGGQDLAEAEQIAAIRRGDPKVGRQLYARLVRVIDSTLMRVVGPDQPDHDDWVQVTFEEVVRSIYDGRFQGRCRLTSWAASIACHVGLNAIRSRKTERGIFDRGRQLEGAELAYGATNPEAMLEARDSLRRLRGALATLSPGRAEAVLLHDAFGYSLPEVAAMTSSSEAAVQSRLVRGRRDLEARLDIAPKATPGARER